MKGYYNKNRYNTCANFVVEGLILKGYYNSSDNPSKMKLVVEGLILKGYYNSLFLLFQS